MVVDTERSYSSDGVNLLTESGPQHMMQLSDGSSVVARQQTTYTYDQGNPGGASITHLLTTKTVGSSFENADARTTTYDYSGQSNLGWTLGLPTSTAVDAAQGGLHLVSTTLYDPTTGAVTESRQPVSPNGGDASATQTIYFTASANGTCGNQPDWAGDPCQTQPAAQPGTSGLPPIPVTTNTYDVWGGTTSTTDSSGAATRTTSSTYDGAGRLTGMATSASVGNAVPTTTYAYDVNTGLRTTETSSDGRTLVTGYDTLGRMVSYTDGDGNPSTYAYDVDGRQTTFNDGKGSQSSSYDSMTGDLTSLQDSAAGTFAATYNADGHTLTESYPNGMRASYTYDETGTATGLSYVKTTNCSTNCTWYTDQVSNSVHNQWLQQQSTLATVKYRYDGAARLTQVQDTPVGQGCTTRVYAYDANSNRLALSSRPANSDGTCASTGGTASSHTYDAADRLTDTGVTYDAWGNTLTLPAADAGATALTSTYYATNTVYTQSQNGEQVTYNLDPAERTRERVSTGNTSSDAIDHYSDRSDNPSWTDSSGGNWTRHIQGMNGKLSGIQSSNGTIGFQFTNLHGDIIGSVASTANATPVLSSNTDEFGVAYSGRTPGRYDWLGGKQRTTELPSGVMNMGARVYVPSLGRFAQTDPEPGASANSYDYANQDPANQQDLTGAGPTAFCQYNFSHSIHAAKHIGGVIVRWFGGVGCSRRMILIGQAFLLETAQKQDDIGARFGQHGQVAQSANSGRRQSHVSGSDPSLYIELKVTIFFPRIYSNAAISVFNRPDQAINPGNHCDGVNNLEFGHGVTCRLYSYRFNLETG
jgi:RHS repeat-associated protein